MNDPVVRLKFIENNKFLIQVCRSCFFSLQLARICIVLLEK